MSDDRIISITFPKCGTCRFAQKFDARGMADCFGVPPIPMMIGGGQDALGRPAIQMEVFSPKVKEDRPACSLYKAKQDFATDGRS